MKMTKILAVLLSVALLCGIVPMVATPVSAAVGAITNGDFETGDFTAWDYYTYSTSIQSSYKQGGSYAVKIGKDSSLAGHIALEQIVPVNTNATYSLSFYCQRRSWSGNASFTVTVDLGTTATSFTSTNVVSATPSNGRYSWTSNSYSFSTTTYKYARIRFNALGSGVDTYLDTIAMTATVTGDTGTHAKPSLTAFGTEYNRPNSDSNNVIKQPGFEATTNAQWNTTAFLTNGVSHVTNDAAGAHSGSGYLKYYRGSTEPTTWSQFSVDLPSEGTYVFSAWVRTPLLSANNTGAASIGIMDKDTGKFLTYGTSGGSYDGHYSNTTTQLRSTATDNNWHLRSVVFYVGGASTIQIGMYGLKSEMYVDDISIHLLSNGVKYEGNQQGTLSASTSVTNKYCESDNNLIPDCNMNGDPSEEFWTIGASGWNNGFLEFNKDATSAAHGNALHFKGTSPASNKTYRYIKFVYVEPNTSYTVSFDYRVVKTGNPLMFIDNNIEKNAVFHTPNLGSASNSWQTYSFTFSTGNYNRIGIVFKDGTGETYFDDFRFFKNSDGIANEPAEELFPTLKHNADGEVLESRMEMDNGKLGLAFLFNLKVTGATRVEWSKDGDSSKFFNADFTNAKVDPFEDGGSYKLVKAGAVVTNQESIGQDEKAFKLDNLNSNLVIDVPGTKTLKLFYTPEGDMIHYAVRVANIPESAMGTVIYMRPYYVFDYNGTEVTVYGDIVFDCYEEIPDINDGWMEWD